MSSIQPVFPVFSSIYIVKKARLTTANRTLREANGTEQKNEVNSNLSLIINRTRVSGIIPQRGKLTCHIPEIWRFADYSNASLGV